MLHNHISSPKEKSCSFPLSSLPQLQTHIFFSLRQSSTSYHAKVLPAAMDEKKPVTTGIPKIDNEVAEILDMPKRTIEAPKRILDPEFPRCKIEDPGDDAPEVFVVGAGWDFPSLATALVAAGVKVVAYETNEQKLGLGQIGLTRAHDIFDLGNVYRVAKLIPDFTQAQLERLPSVIGKIAGNEDYQRLMRKAEVAQHLVRQKLKWEEKEKRYRSLDDRQKVSKEELIKVKRIVLDLLESSNALEIRIQEVDIDLMQSWLKTNTPVFMASGKHVDLKKMHLDHLKDTPGFVGEFLLGNSRTECALEIISARQNDLKENPKKQIGNLPKVAIVGGGASALSCAMDLLQKVDPALLEVVWISPEESKPTMTRSIEKAKSNMSYEWAPGYISNLVLSNNKKKINSVEVSSLSDGKPRPIRCDLLIHTRNEAFSIDEQSSRIKNAWDSVTKKLVDDAPANGLVRDAAILPRDYEFEIRVKIQKPWKASLEDDTLLKSNIKELVSGQNPKEATIVASGDNFMIQRVILLAESLGFKGRLLQVSAPRPDPQVIELEAKLEEIRKDCAWNKMSGRLVGDKTTFGNGKFSLEVRHEGSEEVQKVRNVDAIIMAAGKTNKTPLVKEMIKHGYIVEDDKALCSKHPTLFGMHGFFNSIGPRDINTPSMTLVPFYEHLDLTTPYGWTDAFDSVRQSLNE